MIFENRDHAALLLVGHLKQYLHQNPLILAIPRGGVPLGAVLARELRGQLDIVLVRKLGAPMNSEFAIGAVAESGRTYISPFAKSAGATSRYLEDEVSKQLQLIAHRRAQYDLVKSAISPTNRIVIVVDDGLATGATMIAALEAIREARPHKLICAIPVAPIERLPDIRPYCDELVCLHESDNFTAVGEFYMQFDQVDDQTVLEMLRESALHEN
jgi:predicted phosphoribosyltransferase